MALKIACRNIFPALGEHFIRAHILSSKYRAKSWPKIVEDILLRLQESFDGEMNIRKIKLRARNVIIKANKNTENALVSALEEGSFTKVTQWLSEDGNTNVRLTSKNNQTPLHLAIIAGLPNIANELIISNADSDLRDGFSLTPLHYACKLGNTDIVERLLQHKERYPNRIYDKDKDGLDSLDHASSAGHLETVKYLVEEGKHSNIRKGKGDNTKKALHYACEKGHLDISQYLLLEHSSDCININDEKGKNPLHYAIADGCYDLVTLLVENAADISASDDMKQTPLILACLLDSEKIALYLLSRLNSTEIAKIR